MRIITKVKILFLIAIGLFSCNDRHNTGEILINNLKNDTVIQVSTKVSSPTTLRLYVENISKDSFIVDNSKIASDESTKEIAEDHYYNDFSLHIKVLRGKDSSANGGIKMKIKYALN